MSDDIRKCVPRLPPLVLGLSDDYSRATAERRSKQRTVRCSARSGGGSITDQSRRFFFVKVSRRQYWKFRSNPAKIVSIDGMIKSVKALDTMGGMTPNIAIHMANELFDMGIPKIEEAWGDAPYDFVKQLIIKGMLVPTEAASAGKVFLRHRLPQ